MPFLNEFYLDWPTVGKTGRNSITKKTYGKKRLPKDKMILKLAVHFKQPIQMNHLAAEYGRLDKNGVHITKLFNFLNENPTHLYEGVVNSKLPVKFHFILEALKNTLHAEEIFYNLEKESPKYILLEIKIKTRQITCPTLFLNTLCTRIVSYLKANNLPY